MFVRRVKASELLVVSVHGTDIVIRAEVDTRRQVKLVIDAPRTAVISRNTPGQQPQKETKREEHED